MIAAAEMSLELRLKVVPFRMQKLNKFLFIGEGLIVIIHLTRALGRCRNIMTTLKRRRSRKS